MFNFKDTGVDTSLSMRNDGPSGSDSHLRVFTKTQMNISVSSTNYNRSRGEIENQMFEYDEYENREKYQTDKRSDLLHSEDVRNPFKIAMNWYKTKFNKTDGAEPSFKIVQDIKLIRD